METPQSLEEYFVWAENIIACQFGDPRIQKLYDTNLINVYNTVIEHPFFVGFLNKAKEWEELKNRKSLVTRGCNRGRLTLALDPLNDFAMSELLSVWSRQGNRQRCSQRFLSFIAQPEYKFSRYSQAPVFRFFQCCRKFGMKNEAKLIYERFQSELDDRNIDFYTSAFID